MRKYVWIALLGSSLAAVPMLTGCDQGPSTSTEHEKTTVKPNGQTESTKSKTTENSNGTTTHTETHTTP